MKNADGQAGQEIARTPPIISAVDAAMVEAENLHPQLRRSDCERLIKAALEVYYREPSQEGHAAEPACSAPVRRWQHDETGRVCETPASPGKRWHEISDAPDEALIDNIWHQHTDGMGVYMTYEQFHRAIHQYIRRSAGKGKG